jgi:peptide methionine sulfoxide reductase MsrA
VIYNPALLYLCRPIVLHSSDAQQEDTKLVLSNSNPGNGVEIGSLTHFWPVAPRHQEFYENNITNTYCTREITPVLKSLSELHPSLFLVDREDE